MKIETISQYLQLHLQYSKSMYLEQFLVDWNKCVAARLQPFPNMDIGLQETNGHQYYKNWDKMLTYHPKAGAKWTQSEKGVYLTDKTFYEESGGIFQPSAHYEQMFKNAGK